MDFIADDFPAIGAALAKLEGRVDIGIPRSLGGMLDSEAAKAGAAEPSMARQRSDCWVIDTAIAKPEWMRCDIAI